MKSFTYFYVNEDGDNIPVLTGCDRLENLLWLQDELKEKMQQDYPDAIGNLYLFFEGKTFKIDF